MPNVRPAINTLKWGAMPTAPSIAKHFGSPRNRPTGKAMHLELRGHRDTNRACNLRAGQRKKSEMNENDFITNGVVRRPSGGLYDLPVVGRPARATRVFFDDMAPDEDDSRGVTVGKNVIRYGAVVGAGVAGAAVAAVIVL